MDSSIIDRDGECPRCNSKDIEREVILQTSMRVVSGVVFFCTACGLTRRALASDREAWWNTHRTWGSPHVPEATWEDFEARWPKKVERATYGRAEPLGPILPRPSGR
jgi:late competence protein required for DNA uptake (superfamily II DNA/RNA helicase)